MQAGHTQASVAIVLSVTEVAPELVGSLHGLGAAEGVGSLRRNDENRSPTYAFRSGSSRSKPLYIDHARNNDPTANGF
jgi:hypothetical protein